MSTATSTYKYVDPGLDPERVERARQEHAAKLESNKDPEKRREFWSKLGFIPPIGLGDFLERDYSVNFLVDRCVVERNSLIIAGASKAMKTTTSLHLALSLASGKPFLGKFDTKQSRVMFASAETGEPVLQRNLRGMAEAMSINLQELITRNAFAIQFWVPKIQNADMLDYFSDCIDSVKPEVVFIDPLYLAMNGETQANLSMSGEQINQLVKLVLDKGATPIVDDHVKRSSTNAKEYKPLELEDITGAGKAESFRQWFLLSRRSKLDDMADSHTRNHDLWLTIGGSAGHSATWGLDVSETFSTDFKAVEFEFSIRRGSEVREEARQVAKIEITSKAQQKADAEEARMQRKAEQLMNVFRGDKTKAVNQSDVEAMLGLKNKEAKRVLAILTEAKRLAYIPLCVVRSGRKYDGYMLPGTLNLDAGTSGDCPQ